MAESITPFRKVQVGRESTKGILVPATDVLLGAWEWTEEQEFYRSDNPIGVNANVGGKGSIIRKGSRLSVDTELTFEEITWLLLCGVRGQVAGVQTPPTTGTGYTYTFTPELTGIPTIDTMTVEVVETDGVTNHVAREFGYGMVERFSVALAGNSEARLTYDIFGRAAQTSTPTAALVPYANREIALSNRAKIYLDNSWATLGGTQLSGIIRSLDFEYVAPFSPDYTLDGRTDVDMTKHTAAGRFKATLSVVMELDAVAAAVIANYQANDLRYFRLLIEGSLADAGGTLKKWSVDGAYRFTGPPAHSDDNGVRLVSFDLESVYDATGTKTLEFVVINKESTI